jgi:hypothetical protein
VQHRKDRKTKPWVVRYADGSVHRSASFRTKAEAQVFAAQIRTDQARGEWVSPDAGRVPLERWAAEWLAAYVGRATSTQERARSILRTHIVPRFGQVHLSAITRFAVERMVNEIVASGRSAATAEKALRTLSLVMGSAVDARLIRDNPCRGVKAPRAGASHEPCFLTPAEVEVLSAATRAPYGLLVRFAAYTGLRWGELGALRAGDLDLLRRTATVGRSTRAGRRSPTPSGSPASPSTAAGVTSTTRPKRSPPPAKRRSDPRHSRNRDGTRSTHRRYHMVMARKQVLVQLDDDLVARLDAVADRRGVSRSELLRRGALALLDAEDARAADDELREAYRRVPQDRAIVATAARLAAETAPEW